jgi:hypothetical protein
MILSFTLTMPQNGAWNGKWTGDDKLFCKMHDFGRGKLANNNARFLQGKNFKHDFGDGWAANIKVEKVTAIKAALLKKKSTGFSTYGWMIDSIIEHGEIKSKEK